MIDLNQIEPDKPVLIYGPTASGKSGLALKIAQAQGGVIVNADALQVYQGWPISYSVGDWLRDVTPFLTQRPIIVGGTGLYFTALTQGLAEIPPTPASVREQGDAIALPDLIAGLDAGTLAGLDQNNRARVQRAWEVQATTGRSIRDWQAATPPSLLPLEDCTALCLMPEVDWLGARIAQRFDMMISKAIGATEMIKIINHDITPDSAREAVIIATRQYAKRQRTWARSRMKRWQLLALPNLDGE